MAEKIGWVLINWPTGQRINFWLPAYFAFFLAFFFPALGFG